MPDRAHGRLPDGWEQYDTDEMYELCERLGIDTRDIPWQNLSSRELRKLLRAWLENES